METAKQARDRATVILGEFSIPYEILRVLDANERPLARAKCQGFSDGRYYTHNTTKVSSYYHATYCIQSPVWDFEKIDSIEVRQGFNSDKLRGALGRVVCLRNIMAFARARSAEKKSYPVGNAKRVRTRKAHSCQFCPVTIPPQTEAVMRSMESPGEKRLAQDYVGHYHTECYDKARLTDGSLPPVGERH